MKFSELPKDTFQPPLNNNRIIIYYQGYYKNKIGQPCPKEKFSINNDSNNRN